MKSLIIKIISAAFALVLIVGVYLYSQDFRPIIYKLAESEGANLIEGTTTDPNEFKILFCGTGSPNRSPDRGQPCTALIANGKLFLFDAGEGAIGKLVEYDAPINELEAVFITHLHSDHMSGIAEVLHNTWLFGRTEDNNVIGPPGTEKLLDGIKKAYEDDIYERVRTVGEENELRGNNVFTGAKDIIVEGGNADIVYEKDGLVIKAFEVYHPDWPYAYGYRIEHQGKVIVISGDTAPSEGIKRYAKDADILIHEALNAEIFSHFGKQLDEIGGLLTSDRLERIAKVHTTTLELAQIAADIGVKDLYITHLIPAMPANTIADVFFTSGMDDIYSGNITVARDGQWIEMNP